MYAAAAVVMWAIGFPAAEVLLGIMDPLTLITIRFAMACAVMLPIWWLADGSAILRAPWGWGIVMGGLTFGIATFLLLLAQDVTNAVTVAIVSAAIPLVASIIEVFFGKRRFTSRLIIGLLIAIAGGIISVGGNLSLDIGLGALLVISSGALFMLGSHLAVEAMPHISPIGRATLPFCGGFVIMLIVLAVATPLGWTDGPGRMLTSHEFSMLVIYAVGAMAISQIFFVASVGKIGVAMTSFHLNVAPFWVMIIMVALGAIWSWPQAVGAAVVVLSAIYVQART